MLNDPEIKKEFREYVEHMLSEAYVYISEQILEKCPSANQIYIHEEACYLIGVGISQKMKELQTKEIRSVSQGVVVSLPVSRYDN